MSNRPEVRRFYPYLFTFFPVFHLFAANLGNGYLFTDMLPSLFALALLCAILLKLLDRLCGDPDLAGLIVSAACFLFFSYIPIYEAVNGGAKVGGIRHRHLIPALAILAGGFVAFLFRRARHSSRLRHRLNVLGAIFCLVPLSQAAIRYPWPGTYERLSPPEWPRPSAVGERPDVYLLVLDSYLRGDMLLRATGLDDSPFTRRLEERGFRVARRSRSNYNFTGNSFTSFLNGFYPGSTFEILSRYPGDWNPRLHYNQRSAAFTFLRRLGYRIVAFDVYRITRLANADRLFTAPLDMGAFEEALVLNSPLGFPLTEGLGVRPFGDFSFRRQVRWLEAQFPAAIAEAGPKMVFCHFPLPHIPFVLDEDGSWSDPALPPAGRYSRQMRYTHRIVTPMIDEILASPGGTRSVILLVSDHGWSFADDERVMREEGLANLVAVKLPEGMPNDLPDDITLVNLFRWLYGRLFGVTLPFVEDRFFFGMPSNLDRFVEIR